MDKKQSYSDFPGNKRCAGKHNKIMIQILSLSSRPPGTNTERDRTQMNHRPSSAIVLHRRVPSFTVYSESTSINLHETFLRLARTRNGLHL